MKVTEASIGNPLTRSSGFLRTVASHSLQPYRGCSYGRSLCGVGCYVRANAWVTAGREWGSFLEARPGAAEAYLRHVERERRWARRHRDGLVVFMSSSTDPWVPQERQWRITRGLLEAMVERPPDGLILQTHSHRILDDLEVLPALAARTRLRVHVSIESDRDRLPGLPAPASSVAERFQAAATLRAAGLFVVITVAPLLPLEDPEAFFCRIRDCADACVLDHFVEGDGTPDGSRTRRTRLPAAMEVLDPQSLGLEYRDRMVALACRIMPGRVGVHGDGFAGRWLP